MIFIGAHDWAKTTLKLHEKDKRTYVYTREQLEKGQSHDDLWNAAQVKIDRNLNLTSNMATTNVNNL